MQIAMTVGATKIQIIQEKATTYNLSRDHDNVARLEAGGASYTGQQIEEDDSIISSSGPASALEVALLVVERLTGNANTDKVKKLMMYSPSEVPAPA